MAKRGERKVPMWVHLRSREPFGLAGLWDVAAADNAESNPLLIEIAWDGEWSDDTATLSKHLVVKQVASI
jgi:putative SOS response-associated peptidase YedK